MAGGGWREWNFPRGSSQFDYDSRDNLVTITAADGGVLSLTYDGNLVTQSTWSGTVSFSYNQNWQLAMQSVNGSHQVNYGFDQDGLMTSAGDLSLLRDAQTGQLTGGTLGGISDSWSYNGFGEAIAYSASFQKHAGSS